MGDRGPPGISKKCLKSVGKVPPKMHGDGSRASLDAARRGARLVRGAALQVDLAALLEAVGVHLAAPPASAGWAAF